MFLVWLTLIHALHSAYVGSGIMMLLLLLPVYISRNNHAVQIERMKTVCKVLQCITEVFTPVVRLMREYKSSVKVSAYISESIGFSWIPAFHIFRMIKMFGWEDLVKDEINSRREDELLWARKQKAGCFGHDELRTNECRAFPDLRPPEWNSQV